METDLIRTVGQVAVFGGAALGVFLLLSRDLTRKLVPTETRRLARTGAGVAWAVAVVGVLISVYAEVVERQPPGRLERTSRDERPTLGNVRSLAPHPRPSSDLAQAMEEQLRGASLAFNRPERLRLGRTAYIELILAPGELGVDASTRLTPGLPGMQKRATSSYALRMAAILSGPDFDVVPSGLQERTVLGSREARWAWTIRPITHGPDKPLMLEVFALLERGGHTFPPISVRTFYETFLVEVGWWDQAVDAARDLGTIHAAVAGAGAGGTIVAAGLWFWRRRRGNGADEPSPDTTVIRRRGRRNGGRAASPPGFEDDRKESGTLHRLGAWFDEPRAWRDGGRAGRHH
jgi:hypothetical protein